MNTRIVRRALTGLSLAAAAGLVLLPQNGDSSAQGSKPAPTTVKRPMSAPMTLASMMTGYDGIGDCVRLGPFPRGSLFDGTHIWTTDSTGFNEKLLRVDPDTLTVLQAITIGANLNDLAYDGEYIWVSMFAAGRVAKVRASDGFLVGTFPVNSPADNSHPSPTSIAVDGDVLWAATSGNLSISTLSLDTGAVLNTYFIGSVIPDVLPMPEGIWVSMVSPDRVVLLDRDTGAELASCTAGALPTALVAVDDEIWVSNHHGGTVSIIDRASCSVIATVPLGILPRESVFDGTHVWVCNQESETVSRINRFTLAVVDFPSFGGDPGWPVIVGEHLYVVNHFPDGTLCRVAHVPPDRGCVLQFFDNFELDPIGGLPSNWSVSNQCPPSTDLFIEFAGPDSHGFDLGKSVALVDTVGGNCGAIFSRALTKNYTGQLALEWSERHESLDDLLGAFPGNAFAVVMAGNDPNHPQFRGWIVLATRNPETGGDANLRVFQWEPNRWYRLRVEIDIPENEFDFFVDGDLIIADVPFRVPRDVIGAVGFSTGGIAFSPQRTRRWVDDFKELDCEEGVVTVRIDIKPGGHPNSINLGSNGSVPVAIFSSVTFDATEIDPVTVTLAGASVRFRRNGMVMASFEDVDGDGLLDLVVHVSTQALQLTEGDVVAILEGQTFDGTHITGSDSVRIVP